MATSPLALTDSIHEGRRPSRIDTPPAKGEIKKLRDRLLTYGRDDGRAAHRAGLPVHRRARRRAGGGARAAEPSERPSDRDRLPRGRPCDRARGCADAGSLATAVSSVRPRGRRLTSPPARR